MIPATLFEARNALAEFVPRAAHFYAKERNFDRGPQNRNNVSLLSAAIQRRILTEKEVIQEVLKKHSFEASEKFLQEVLWRSYWKSWLELRPSVWTVYQKLSGNLVPSEIHSKALAAQTGIRCFDEWRKELRETGYLHNHARMWFASIWIFTLNLPWFLGAQLFEKELLDFDPASNTLSWRWVAGLHTPGKNYLARAENIKTFTEGRFNPEGQLQEKIEPPNFKVPPLELNPEGALPASPPKGNWGLLVHSEDLSLEQTEFSDWPFKQIAVFRDSRPKSPQVQAFEDRAFQDAEKRLREKFPCPMDSLSKEEKLCEWVERNQLDGICLIKPWQGPLLGLLNLPLPLQTFRRAYDIPFMGKARSGFFSFKEEMKERISHYAVEKESSLEKLCLMSLKK